MAARVESLENRRARRTTVAALPMPSPRVVHAVPALPRRRRSGLRALLRETAAELWDQLTPAITVARVTTERRFRVSRCSNAVECQSAVRPEYGERLRPGASNRRKLRLIRA